MGVIYGLEAARTLGRGIDVAAWADEEGHFGSFIGSRSFCGLLTEQEIDVCANRETGTTLREALRQAGFSGRPRQKADAGALSRLSGSAYRAGQPTWRTSTCASASSPRSSAAIGSASSSKASRTMPAPHVWRCARMPASR